VGKFRRQRKVISRAESPARIAGGSLIQPQAVHPFKTGLRAAAIKN
jgi:hypothetical protein